MHLQALVTFALRRHLLSPPRIGVVRAAQSLDSQQSRWVPTSISRWLVFRSPLVLIFLGFGVFDRLGLPPFAGLPKLLLVLDMSNMLRALSHWDLVCLPSVSNFNVRKSTQSRLKTPNAPYCEFPAVAQSSASQRMRQMRCCHLSCYMQYAGMHTGNKKRLKRGWNTFIWRFVV